MSFSATSQQSPPLQGAVLGPGEFFEGLSLGGREFIGATVGRLHNNVRCVLFCFFLFFFNGGGGRGEGAGGSAWILTIFSRGT